MKLEQNRKAEKNRVFSQNLPLNEEKNEKNIEKSLIFFHNLPLNEEFSENIQKITKKWKMDGLKNNPPMRDDFPKKRLFSTFSPSIL